MSDQILHILVVDDERSIRRYLHTSLTAKGHQVDEVATGAEAITAVQDGHYDLIILDLGLTDMDGVQVTRRVREWSR